MDAFALCVLVVLLMALPALSWWGRLAHRARGLNAMSDQRQLDFVTRNAGAAGNDASFGNPHVRPAQLAEHYFEDLAQGSLHDDLTHGHSWEDIASDPSMEGPSINPASGLPMLNSAIDVAGNPFGLNLNDELHHGMGMHHASDSFGGHGLSGHSIGHDFHSGHDAFGHGPSWLD